MFSKHLINCSESSFWKISNIFPVFFFTFSISLMFVLLLSNFRSTCVHFHSMRFINEFIYFFFFLFADNKPALSNDDWKKLWMEAGNINQKSDNAIDSSDSPVFEETEVSCIHTFSLFSIDNYDVHYDDIQTNISSHR